MGAEVSKVELTPEELAACVKKGRDDHDAAVKEIRARARERAVQAQQEPPREQPTTSQPVVRSAAVQEQQSVRSDAKEAPRPSRMLTSAVKRPLSESLPPSLGRILKRARPDAARPDAVSSATSASPQSPADPEERQQPDWYQRLKKDNTRNANDSQAATLMQRLKNEIAKCAKETGTAKERAFNEIRWRLHQLVFESVNGKLLRQNMMLHNESGLPQLFDSRYSNGVDYPFDIRADAEELYNKWSSEIFETDLLRGIIAKGRAGAEGRNADKIDPNWPTVSARYHGNGKLLNGQWFPTQLTAYRDGAHGVTQGGICGATGEGAYSCILSDGYSDDEDHGDTIMYCGTDQTKLPETGKSIESTESTKRMIESVSSDKPVRVLRSHNCPSQWKPLYGFRYDGLYDVVSMEQLDPPHSLRQRHRFKLVRRAGQDPIRGGKGPEQRPTQQEIEAHDKDKRFRGIAVKGKKGTKFPTWG